MKERFDAAFARFGLTVTVCRGESETQTKAFFQPLTKERRDEPFSVTPLGAVDERCWRYLGPACVRVEVGDRIFHAGKGYLARNAAAVYAGEEILYYWAVLCEEEEAAV